MRLKHTRDSEITYTTMMQDLLAATSAVVPVLAADESDVSHRVSDRGGGDCGRNNEDTITRPWRRQHFIHSRDDSYCISSVGISSQENSTELLSGTTTITTRQGVSARGYHEDRHGSQPGGKSRNHDSKLSYKSRRRSSSLITGNTRLAISNLCSWWWLYCCCCLCLLSNYPSFTVNGAYPDTDELINELDRPSK